VTLVDADDIVGAGAPGGNTHVVEAVARRRDLRALVPVHDPAVFEAAWAAPEGETLEVVLSGTPGYGQPAVPLSARVAAKAEDEFGKRVRLVAGGLEVAVCPDPPLPIHPRFWRALGVSPRAADVMVQKNFFHYRIFHLLTSFVHLPVVSRGATSLRGVTALPLDVPSRPAVALDDWRDGDRLHRGATT
jgi:microcystin degradation protein MlrC